LKCRICDNEKGNSLYIAKEMMLGLRDLFEYFQCAVCECLQISEIPGDTSKYYSGGYYSQNDGAAYLKSNALKRFIKRRRNKFAVFGNGLFGRLLYRTWPHTPLRALSYMEPGPKARILDVGCGQGLLPLYLKEMGFDDVLGIDPHIHRDIQYENGLRILKKTLPEMDGQWDLIMFHHAFEHTANPVETLDAAGKLLTPNGMCLIRTPTVSSYAWNHYRTNWFQLDAPRHFHIFSVEGLAELASRCSFEVDGIVFDSGGEQFWRSEEYAKDISADSEMAYDGNPSKSDFRASEIRAFRRRASELNDLGRGDQAAFYLRKS